MPKLTFHDNSVSHQRYLDKMKEITTKVDGIYYYGKEDTIAESNVNGLVTLTEENYEALLHVITCLAETKEYNERTIQFYIEDKHPQCEEDK